MKSLMIPARVISVHFPKAAGSSLKKEWERLLGDDAAFDYEYAPLLGNGLGPSEFPAGKRLVHGHFKASRFQASDAYRLTFLREPVENLLSIYCFWLNLPEHGNPVHRYFLREKPHIREFAYYPGIHRLMSDSYFGDFDMNRFDFIGFCETRARDISRLASALGLPLQDTNANVAEKSPERLHLSTDKALMRDLREALSADVRFYEHWRNVYA